MKATDMIQMEMTKKNEDRSLFNADRIESLGPVTCTKDQDELPMLRGNTDCASCYRVIPAVSAEEVDAKTEGLHLPANPRICPTT